MSHITKITTKMENIETVKAALTFLGLSYKENEKAKVWGNKTTDTQDIVVPTPLYDIGISKNDKGIISVEADHMVWSDFFMLSQMQKYERMKAYPNQEKFTGILQQAYNVVMAKQQADTIGHTIQIGEPDEAGVIHARVTGAIHA